MKQHRIVKQNELGFSLIELMIVIAIIGLLISVGTIGWKTAVKAGNETAAIQTLDNIRKMQVDYAARHRGSFATFDDLIKDSDFDKNFAGDRPTVNGYVFTLKLVPKSQNQPSSYSCNADPQVPTGISATGKRYFYVDTNVSSIRANNEGPATAEDPSLAQ